MIFTHFFLEPSLSNALDFTAFLFVLAILIQTLEFLVLKKYWSGPSAIWTYSNIKGFQAWLLNDRFLWVVLLLRVPFVLVFLFFPNPWSLAFFLGTQVLIALRWRGTMNGGSDYLSFILLLMLTGAFFFRENLFLVKLCLGYIAIQVLLSYFIAGVVKLKNPEWRNGSILPLFLSSVHTSPYNPPPNHSFFQDKKILQVLSAWGIMLFELSSVIVLFNPVYCMVFMGFGIFFHLQNAAIFGLNRFFLVWVSAYPLLYYFSL